MCQNGLDCRVLRCEKWRSLSDFAGKSCCDTILRSVNGSCLLKDLLG